ncbi:PPK2 family polyphosphate:nucleotide phosphotransferase [Arcanobacterium pluranimalium]|uniref:PPK2 family polyphosphate kinase n=1 Tax=Arcanobacterium pluranimalium TaxID=108028 RepID=UPI00195EAC46|nr:PPK2 family polyphosphate kinase [Arcanobacterium pluranimalium]MBM7824816.1 PPK2 family polyphosphate:nucleotide phosphotransferase [Arcanobacterium pluranimalium]
MAKKSGKPNSSTSQWAQSPRQALQVGEDFILDDFDRSSTPGWTLDKDSAEDFMAKRGELMSELQERLFAAGKYGDQRRVLLVVQGLDTAGKGGVARHVLGMVDPQGVALASFGVPTKEEASHHFLWRIRRALPKPGRIGLFDRSHYEDVLVQRVEKIVEEPVWRKRYGEINRFEKKLVDDGVTIIKVALMVSHEEQAVRLAERIVRPDKKWKYNPSDIDTRQKWDEYQQAYQDVFAQTSTEWAPWYVIPADNKWYARLAITELLVQALIDLDLDWPKPRWIEDVQLRRLNETMDDAENERVTKALDGLASEVSEDLAEFSAEVEAADDDAAGNSGAKPGEAVRDDAAAADNSATSSTNTPTPDKKSKKSKAEKPEKADKKKSDRKEDKDGKKKKKKDGKSKKGKKK